jgi:hypothetical protein
LKTHGVFGAGYPAPSTPSYLERHAQQRLENAGIAERARADLRHGAEARHVEGPVGIAAQRRGSDRGQTVDHSVHVGIAVEVQRAIVPGEVRVIERVECVQPKLEVHPLF